jgi:hypothetical protein
MKNQSFAQRLSYAAGAAAALVAAISAAPIAILTLAVGLHLLNRA